MLVGIDVGSTTVKTVVRSTASKEALLYDYRRHESRQAATVLRVLHRIETELAVAENEVRVFMTGSGGHSLAEVLGARFVQEVAAVSVAVDAFFPEVRSVVELGGQDAKMIFFQDSSLGGQRRKIATMNDKCAGGTGVVIEKIAARLHVPFDRLVSETFEAARIYPIAGKCGVFAETDITGLQKQGVPVDDLIASLFHAIVLQNLSVLTRGHTLMPTVLLLGGPNAFFPGMQHAWRQGLLDLWKRKNVALAARANPCDLVVVPPRAEYFAAVGAIEFGAAESETAVQFQGAQALEKYLENCDRTRARPSSERGLCSSPTELESFRRLYSLPAMSSQSIRKDRIDVALGLDGGSTSTKAVAIDTCGEVLASSYRLSQADPVADAIEVLRELYGKLVLISPEVNVLGLATTGYSKDLLKKVFSADVALVETVAHAKSSMRLDPEVDAIIDVGGQDIKIIVLKDGAVKDFKLNTQCSAGNGYFLQAAAAALGVRIEDFAETAFRARRIPKFSYGCAVFLQSDIVNFQRQGWQPDEILAGLATVLPKNIFLYVAGVSNISTLGRRFVLQGGTQRNLAVVKAEVDYIREHYHGSGEPEIAIHPHCREAGAIGAALEALENYHRQGATAFSGFESLDSLQYEIRRDESTRCSFCTNQCLRTFVELTSGVSDSADGRRVVIATCERGEAESADAVRKINASWNSQRERCPNFVQLAAEQVWKPQHPERVLEERAHWLATPFRSSSETHKRSRAQVHIGIPRSLSLYTYAPLFSAYFESLGVPAENLHYSHFSSPKHYEEAAGFSAIDPCFPSKVAIAHVYELLQMCKKQPLDAIFFPMFDTLTSPLKTCIGSNACPSGAATPEAVKAAFSRNVNWFDRAKVRYVNPVLELSDRELFAYQMFTAWRDLLRLSWHENTRAVEIAYAAWKNFEDKFRQRALRAIGELEHDGQVGIVMLGRPYHHDPGLNQGILEELQRFGYPIFSQSLLPLDEDLLDRLFGMEVASGIVQSPLDISDVWKNTFSASSNHKIWAAKFVARHPNLISVELSNFKCGHDAFISRTVEQIIEQSGKPHFSFRDLDENRPLASIRIRVETIHYFLTHYREHLLKRPARQSLVGPTGEFQNQRQAPAPETRNAGAIRALAETIEKRTSCF